MDDTQNPPALPARRLLFSVADVAELFGMTYTQIDKLLRRGAFGDDWQSFPWTGKQRRIPRARVLKWAQATEDEVPV